MLADRIKGAITFKKGVYSEVANDATFTNTAWIIVLVVEILNQLGSHSGSIYGLFQWFIGGLILGALGLGAFALASYLVAMLATNMFKATVDYKQVVRALGLANIWGIIGVIGILGFIPLLRCLTTPITILAGLAGLAADLIAIKESTSMEWAGTIVTTIVAVLVTLIVTGVAALILGVLHLI